MCVSDSDCGSQDSWPLRNIDRNENRDLECEIRGYLERNLDAEEIATRMCLDRRTVDKYLSTLRSSL